MPDEKEEVRQLVGEQERLLASVQKTLRNFKKDPSSRKTNSYHTIRLEILNSYRAEFRENHRVLTRQSKNAEVKQLYIDAGIEESFEDAYLEAMECIRESLEAKCPIPKETDKLASDLNNTTIASLSNGVPLPVVKLPTFTGDFVEWPTFKEIFTDRVHNNEALNNLQRFHYLTSALDGDAAKDIQHISIIGQNYPDAWKMLNEQYDDKRILFTHYMDVLHQQPEVPKNNAAALKHFTQTCRACVSSIKKLEVNVDEQNEILVYFLIKKLPDTIRMEWERSLRKQSTIPTFAELCSLLDEQYIMLLSAQKTNSERLNANQHKKYDNAFYQRHRDMKTMYATKNSIN